VTVAPFCMWFFRFSLGLKTSATMSNRIRSNAWVFTLNNPTNDQLPKVRRVVMLVLRGFYPPRVLHSGSTLAKHRYDSAFVLCRLGLI